MKIVIDPERCQGHSRCWALAPDLFHVDDYGTASVKADGPLSTDQEAKARLAIANCPEHAIRLEDK